MKTLATVTLVFAATLGAFAAHPPKRQQQRQEKEKANEETKHKIAEKHGVKPARIFATGFSMGGGLVCSLLNDDPTLFARALVVGASGEAGAVADVRAEVLSYHGADDDLIPVTRVKAYAEALCAKRPGAMKVEVLPKIGHAESEEAAYAKQEAWKWLFR